MVAFFRTWSTYSRGVGWSFFTVKLPALHDLFLCYCVQDLMTYDDEEPDMTYGPGPSDMEGRLAAVSHLLAALVTTLDPQHLRRLATRLMSDSCLWVSRLFRSG